MSPAEFVCVAGSARAVSLGRVVSAAMPYLRVVDHDWLGPFRVESQGPGKFSQNPTVQIYLGSDDFYIGAIRLIEAEQLARQILDVVEDAKQGRFTGSA